MSAAAAFDGFDPLAFASNDLVWLLVPYEWIVAPSGRTQRRLELHPEASAILQAGGDFSETEIEGDQALVRVRAPKGLLKNMALNWQPVADPAELWTPTRVSPISGRVFECKPIDDVVVEVPDVDSMRVLTERVEEIIAICDAEGYYRIPEPWPIAVKLMVMLGARGYGLDRASTGTFPTTGILKTFTAADGFLTLRDSDFSILGGASDSSITGNRIQNDSAPYVGDFIDTPASYGPDSECYIQLVDEGAYFGVFARMTDSAATYDAYQASWGNGSNNLTLQDNDEAVQTQIGSSVTLAKAVNDQLGLECIGSTIVCYTETGGVWTARVTTTNSRITVAGAIGFDMFQSGTTIALDNMGGGTVVAAAEDARARQTVVGQAVQRAANF